MLLLFTVSVAVCVVVIELETKRYGESRENSVFLRRATLSLGSW